MPSLRQQLLELIDNLAPEVQKAFTESVNGIKSEIVLREVVERLERRDIEGAIEALHIQPSAFARLGEAVRQAFNAGGSLVAGAMPKLADFLGARVVWRWDVSNQRAESIIRELSSTRITEVSEDTKELARQRIVAGYEKGHGPQSIALDLIGRTDKITKIRMGGLIGLTSGLSSTVQRAETSLLAGDIAGMRAYLTLSRRDKRFDRSVAKAIREGRALAPEDVSKIIFRLKDSYLRFRAERIGRSETLMSVMSAKHEAYQQGLEAAGRDENLVTRTWRNSGKHTSRHTHKLLNGQTVRGMSQPFLSSSGAMMRFPGDTSLGAPASEIVNCECDQDYEFDFAEAFARSRGR